MLATKRLSAAVRPPAIRGRVLLVPPCQPILHPSAAAEATPGASVTRSALACHARAILQRMEAAAGGETPDRWAAVPAEESAALLRALAPLADALREESLRQRRLAEFQRARLTAARRAVARLRLRREREPPGAVAGASAASVAHRRWLLPAGPVLPLPPV